MGNSATGGAGFSKKVVNSEAFPELGETAAPVETTKESTGKRSGGPPKFTSVNQNRFDQIEVHKTQREEKKNVKRDDYNDRPRERKDDFFGNFRENNKNIKADAPAAAPKEEGPKKTSSSSGGPPKFFTNNNPKKMTMAKAQEEAEKKKEELKKLEELEDKKEKKTKKFETKDKFARDKKFGDKKSEDKGFKRSDKKTAEIKPKEKKPKVVKEKAVLEDEWGKGGLEDVL